MEHHGDADIVLVHTEMMGNITVLAEFLAMVSGDDNDRVFCQTAIFKCLVDTLDLLVDIEHSGVVHGRPSGPARLCLRRA